MNNVITYKGRLPEKPIRPNIAGRLAKKNLTKKSMKEALQFTDRCGY